jgi:hypothetical protein
MNICLHQMKMKIRVKIIIINRIKTKFNKKKNDADIFIKNKYF